MVTVGSGRHRGLLVASVSGHGQALEFRLTAGGGRPTAAPGVHHQGPIRCAVSQAGWREIAIASVRPPGSVVPWDATFATVKVTDS